MVAAAATTTRFNLRSPSDSRVAAPSWLPTPTPSLLPNADTLTTWLESGVGEVQDWNNLKAERSLSSQDVPQRLVLSYVYDLPIGHGKKYFADATGVMSKVVSGWGVDGV